MLTNSATPKPVVSVIIPTYNFAGLIGETLESVRAQTYHNWECIVVDDGSTDGTPDVVSRISAQDSRIKYLRQERAGQSAARNKALCQSVGQYIQFLDADDLIEARKFERQIAYLEKHPEVDIVYGSASYFGEENTEPPTSGISGNGKQLLAALVRNNFIVINAPLVRRTVVDRVGLFNERILSEDWEYWLRCAALGMTIQFADLPGTMSLVRCHGPSSSHNKRRMYRSSFLIRRKMKTLIDDKDILALNRQALIRDQEHLAIYVIVEGSLREIVVEALRAAMVHQNIKFRGKWLFCALAAPFVNRKKLRLLVSTPIADVIAGRLTSH